MGLKKISWLLLLPLLVVSNAFAADEMHEEETAPSGDVYIFLKAANPLPIEQMAFMSKLHQEKGLRTFTNMMPLSPNEMAIYQKDPAAYIDKTGVPPRNYKPDQKALQELASTIRPYKAERGDVNIARKYNVNVFPSLLYLTPDGYIFRYEFKPFDSKVSQKNFWRDYAKYRNNKPRNNMFKNKKWSQ
tara:strand:+ start:5204 stop:5767 length:564 start_codon:yes stop_codon:yes gene_type:complete